MPTRPARRIRIYCPVGVETYAALLAGDVDAADRDPATAAILAIIRAANPLGDFGLYQGVFELGFGLEGFTPTAAASPVAGVPGAATMSPTLVITSWADADADIDAALAQIAAAHPWEVPVIEIAAAELPGRL